MTKVEQINVNGFYLSQVNFLLTLFPITQLPYVIISVPHDRVFPFDTLQGLMLPKTQGVVGRDKHVWHIAKDILMQYQANAGLVWGLLPRKIVDYNRSYPEPMSFYIDKDPEVALVDLNVSPFYETYHRNLRRLLKKSIRAYGTQKVLLLDLHAFNKQPEHAPEDTPYDLVLGTHYKKTIRIDSSVDEDLARHLAILGYNVYLPTETPIKETGDRLSGNFISWEYANKLGISTIQIEIAPRFRDNKELGAQLSQDLANFIKHYSTN